MHRTARTRNTPAAQAILEKATRTIIRRRPSTPRPVMAGSGRHGRVTPL
jgi:hypothetical protein